MGRPIPREWGANLIISTFAQYELKLKISSQSVHNFSSYPAHKQNNERTKQNDYIIPDFVGDVTISERIIGLRL